MSLPPPSLPPPPPPPPPPPSPPPPPPPAWSGSSGSGTSTTAPARRRPGRVIAGAALIAVGVVGAVVCAVVSQAVVRSAIDDLARAPGGCTTTLQIDEPGRYAVFLESEGTMTDVSGTCPFPEGRFRSRATPSDVDLAAAAEDGSDVAVIRFGKEGYSTSDAEARRIGDLVVDRSGRVDLTVTSDVEGAVIAVGVDPDDLAEPWLVAAVVIGVVGVLVGAVLVGLGLRRRSAPSDLRGGAGP